MGGGLWVNAGDCFATATSAIIVATFFQRLIPMLARPLDMTFAFKAIALLPGLSGADKRVAVAIIDHFNRKDGRCFPTVERLATLLGLAPRTVLRAIEKLHKLGLILRDRHAGPSCANSYEPNWECFREADVTWRERFDADASDVTTVSRTGRQDRHQRGDKRVTQTCPTNQSKEPGTATVAPSAATAAPRIGRGQAEEGKGPPRVAPPRLLTVRSTRPRDALAQICLKRWDAELRARFAGQPDVYAAIVEAIDDELQAAATAAEMGQRGDGVKVIIEKLRSTIGVITTKKTASR